MKKAATKKKKAKEFQTPYTVTGALVKGNAITKLSMLIMGLGNIAHKQIVKGLMFLAIEVAYLYYMISYGFYAVSMLPSLGWREREKVWNVEEFDPDPFMEQLNKQGLPWHEVLDGDLEL